MKKLFFLFAAVFLTACAAQNLPPKNAESFSSVSPENFEKMAKNPDAIVIDLRTPAEIADGKIFPDAREIDFYDPNFRDKISKLDRDKKYLIYCRSGARSKKALELFQKLGFSKVSDLAGGKRAFDAFLRQKKSSEIPKKEILKKSPREIQISAKRFEFSPREIRVKKGEKIILKIKNADATHGIFIPALGVSGNEKVEFTAEKSGEFDFQCANFCGSGHREMTGKIIVE